VEIRVAQAHRWLRPCSTLAAESRCIEVLKLLVLDGIFDFQDLNEYGEDVFNFTVSFGNKEMVSYLLSLPNINPNTADIHETTALHCAAWHGSEIVSLLLSDWRVDVKPVDSEGNQPIQCAARDGYLRFF
jgi:Ankyrin repeats (3 copies)